MRSTVAIAIAAALVLVTTVAAQPPAVFVATGDMTLYSSPPWRLGPIPFFRFEPDERGSLQTGAVFRIVGESSLEEPPWLHVETADGRDGWLRPVTTMVPVPLSGEAGSETLRVDELVLDAAIDYYSTTVSQEIGAAIVEALTIARDNAAGREQQMTPDWSSLLIVIVPYNIGALSFYRNAGPTIPRPGPWGWVAGCLLAYCLLGPIGTLVFASAEWGRYDAIALALFSAEQGYLVSEKVPRFLRY